MSLPYYKFFPAETLGNYQIMSLPHDAIGVWFTLGVCQLWQHQGRIADDPVYISTLLKLTVEQWISYRALFLERLMIQIIDGCVTDSALREKWKNAEKISETRSANRLLVLEEKRQKKLLKSGKKTK